MYSQLSSNSDPGSETELDQIMLTATRLIYEEDKPEPILIVLMHGIDGLAKDFDTMEFLIQ